MTEAPMFSKGRRLFTSASIGLIVVAALHSMGHFASQKLDAPTQAVVDAMEALRIPVGAGMSPSLMDIHNSLSLFMTIGLLVIGLQNLAVASLDAGGAIVRRLAILCALGNGAVVVMFGVHRVFPPLVSLAIVEVLFVLAVAVPARR